MPDDHFPSLDRRPDAGPVLLQAGHDGALRV
jgi:hypothetical protein